MGVILAFGHQAVAPPLSTAITCLRKQWHFNLPNIQVASLLPVRARGTYSPAQWCSRTEHIILVIKILRKSLVVMALQKDLSDHHNNLEISVFDWWNQFCRHNIPSLNIIKYYILTILGLHLIWLMCAVTKNHFLSVVVWVFWCSCFILVDFSFQLSVFVLFLPFLIALLVSAVSL